MFDKPIFSENIEAWPHGPVVKEVYSVYNTFGRNNIDIEMDKEKEEIIKKIEDDREVSEALNEQGIDTDIFWIGKKPLSGCIACKSCMKNNKCVFHDSVNEFLEISGDYEGFVFGTPVHWGGASGGITSFMDRVFYTDLNGGGNRFLLKPAAAVMSARRAGTTATYGNRIIQITDLGGLAVDPTGEFSQQISKSLKS